MPFDRAAVGHPDEWWGGPHKRFPPAPAASKIPTNSEIESAVRNIFGRICSYVKAYGVAPPFRRHFFSPSPCWRRLSLPGGLRIEALRGDGANNNPALGVTVSPAVRLLDASGKPVPKALIVFTGPATGPSVDFGDQGATAETVTDESGVAIAPRLRPVGGN